MTSQSIKTSPEEIMTKLVEILKATLIIFRTVKSWTTKDSTGAHTELLQSKHHG